MSRRTAGGRLQSLETLPRSVVSGNVIMMGRLGTRIPHALSLFVLFGLTFLRRLGRLGSLRVRLSASPSCSSSASPPRAPPGTAPEAARSAGSRPRQPELC